MGASPLRNETGSAVSHGEALSAWIDGELDERDCHAVLDRLRSDDALREQFDSIHWVGDALRSHEVAAGGLPGLARRVSQALQDEPALLAPRAMPSRSLLSAQALRRHAATGVTLAAAAAVLAVVALPQLRGPQGGAAPVATEQVAAAGQKVPPASPSAQARQPGRGPGLGAAGSPQGLVAARDPGTLDAYFRAHREMAPQGVMPEAVAYIRGEPDR